MRTTMEAKQCVECGRPTEKDQRRCVACKAEIARLLEIDAMAEADGYEVAAEMDEEGR